MKATKLPQVRQNAVGRDRVFISDKSIRDTDNVPLLGITTKLQINTAIKHKCIEVLQQSKYQNHCDEVIIIMQTEWPFNILWKNIGNERVVGVNKEYYSICKENKLNSLIAIHNHPSATGLSGQDMHRLIENDALIAVIAVGNCGDRAFAMVKNENYNKDSANNYINEFKIMPGENGDQYYERLANGIKQNLTTLGLDYVTNPYWRQP